MFKLHSLMPNVMVKSLLWYNSKEIITVNTAFFS